MGFCTPRCQSPRSPSLHHTCKPRRDNRYSSCGPQTILRPPSTAYLLYSSTAAAAAAAVHDRSQIPFHNPKGPFWSGSMQSCSPPAMCLNYSFPPSFRQTLGFVNLVVSGQQWALSKPHGFRQTVGLVKPSLFPANSGLCQTTLIVLANSGLCQHLGSATSALTCPKPWFFWAGHRRPYPAL